MTPLRRRMLEDMQVRNLSPNTQKSYVHQVSLFARHFRRSPESLGPEEIRTYQVHLTNEKKLSPASIAVATAALRFVYTVTLNKRWDVEAVLPMPQQPKTLPVILSPEGVRHFLSCVSRRKGRTVLTVCYAAGLRISEAIALRPIDIDPKHLGAEIGLFAVLPTWGQNLMHHPHLHCVVPGGGLSADGERWVPCRPGFFLPVRVLSRLFRRRFLERLKQVFDRGELQFFSTLEELREPEAFRRYLDPLRKKEWVVYAKAPFAGPGQVLDYVGRYTHRVAISNHRLVDIEDGHVTFRWKDYRDGNAQK